jgi:glutaminase
MLTGVILSVLHFQIIAQAKKSKAATPGASAYQVSIDKAYAKYKDLKEGKNAGYIKELAEVDRSRNINMLKQMIR